MNSKRLYWLLISVLGLLFVGLLAGTYEANKLLGSQASKLITLKAKSLALASEQQGLIKAKKDIITYSGLEKITKSVVPQDKDQAESVREIVNIAGTYGISLAAINFPASTLGTVVASATTTTSSADNAKTSSANSLSQVQPVKNIPGVYQLQITVVGDPAKPVDYDKFISFLSALEHNRRTAQVSTIAIQPNAVNRSLLTFTLTLNEYIKP